MKSRYKQWNFLSEMIFLGCINLMWFSWRCAITRGHQGRDRSRVLPDCWKRLHRDWKYSNELQWFAKIFYDMLAWSIPTVQLVFAKSWYWQRDGFVKSSVPFYRIVSRQTFYTYYSCQVKLMRTNSSINNIKMLNNH